MNATIKTTEQARRYLKTFVFAAPNDYLADDEIDTLIEASPESCVDCGIALAPWFDFCASCATTGEPNTCQHAIRTEHGYCLDCGEVVTND